jgi:diguanylate cyclase (GGDEF)-like protein/PAS domain S-box-containing protein
LALSRFGGRWVYKEGLSKDDFLHEAAAYYKDLPGFQALEWVDKEYYVRWVVPLAGNEQAVDLDLGFEENRWLALEQAKNGRSPVMSNSIDLVQGGKGFLVYFPLFVKNNFDGFMLAVFKVNSWLDFVYKQNEEHDQLRDVRFSVQMDEVPAYYQEGWKEGLRSDDIGKVSRIMFGHTFKIYCQPTSLFFKKYTSLFPYLATAAGLTLSLLLAFVVYAFQKANNEAWRTYAATVALHKEIQERKDAEVLLQQASARLSLATNAGRIGVWSWNIDENTLEWDVLMYEIYDVPTDVVPKYETWRNAVHEDDVQYAELHLKKAIDGIAAFDIEFRIKTGEGKLKYIKAAAKVERDAEGKPLRMIGVNWDITLRKEVEANLAAERQRLAAIIRGTNVGTWEWNIQTGETVFNERWASIVGYTLDEISPTSIETWMKFAHPEDLKESTELLEKHFSGELEYYECEARMKHRNGKWIWVLDRGKVATWTSDGKPLLMSGTHKDITEQKEREAQIKHLATHDPLTDLPTLRLAKDRLDMAVATAQRKNVFSAVLFVDLDGFKQVNDTLGHDAGDEVLRDTAKRLLSSIRRVDTAARIGGDEFLVILTELNSKNDVEFIAQKILKSIKQPYLYHGNQISVGASIGIALCPSDYTGTDVEKALRLADEAMYSVKKSGKNGYAFAEELKK